MGRTWGESRMRRSVGIERSNYWRGNRQACRLQTPPLPGLEAPLSIVRAGLHQREALLQMPLLQLPGLPLDIL